MALSDDKNGAEEAPRDALDGWQMEEILVDLDPSVDVEFLKQAEALSGKLPPSKTPRDQLIKTHNSYVKKQGGWEHAPRLVKKLILALAYPPSIKPIKELETVGNPRRWCSLDDAFG
jgi:hypothetical protein